MPCIFLVAADSQPTVNDKVGREGKEFENSCPITVGPWYPWRIDSISLFLQMVKSRGGRVMVLQYVEAMLGPPRLHWLSSLLRRAPGYYPKPLPIHIGNFWSCLGGALRCRETSLQLQTQLQSPMKVAFWLRLGSPLTIGLSSADADLKDEGEGHCHKMVKKNSDLKA